ncbi:hypothetical protein D7Y41_32790 [Anaerotruncus sp. 1XD22-93]|nr:hypothetical protein D7Y41_32790 [Anaerotruncus sp. 1XD22-93]
MHFFSLRCVLYRLHKYATLQKPVAWLRFLFFQFRGRGVCFIAGDVKRGGRGIQGAWKGSAGVALWRPHCRQFATESMQAIFLLLGGREAAHGQIRGFIEACRKRELCGSAGLFCFAGT